MKRLSFFKNITFRYSKVEDIDFFCFPAFLFLLLKFTLVLASKTIATIQEKENTSQFHSSSHDKTIGATRIWGKLS